MCQREIAGCFWQGNEHSSYIVTCNFLTGRGENSVPWIWLAVQIDSCCCCGCCHMQCAGSDTVQSASDCCTTVRLHALQTAKLQPPARRRLQQTCNVASFLPLCFKTLACGKPYLSFTYRRGKAEGIFLPSDQTTNISCTFMHTNFFVSVWTTNFYSAGGHSPLPHPQIMYK